MVSVDWLTQEVLMAVPNANVEVIDLHGSGDHFHVRIISQNSKECAHYNVKSKYWRI